jgi:hypothetical protein
MDPEHVHFLVSRAPYISDEKLATVVADSSERFINENKLVNGKFEWQRTASAFSVSKSDVDPARAGQVHFKPAQTSQKGNFWR